ncbi:MAG: hypothetical protein ACK4UN_00155 [Limisphaerales bacterium]
MINQLPGNLPGWPNDFNPLEFGDMLPDNDMIRRFMPGGLRELRRQLTLFLYQVVSPDDYPQLSVAEQPDEDIEQRCDDWIRMFVSAIDRKHMVPPADLRKWVAVRARIALLYSELQLMWVEEQNKKIPIPDMRGNFAGEILSRLIDFWHEQGKELWQSYPDRTSTDEGTSLTWYWKQKGLTLKPATTWPEVLKLADDVLADLYRNVRFRCPTGEVCSELYDSLSQNWLTTAIFVDDRSAFKPDRDTARWIGARLETAKLIIKGYIGNPAKAPLPEGTTQQALYVLAITQWNEILAPLWAGFGYKQGKLVWEARRCAHRRNPF